MTKRAAIYIRVSVLKEEALSPEMQLSKCESYCRVTGEEYRVFQDLDFSGKDTRRPAFQAMKREIEAGAIGKVVGAPHIDAVSYTHLTLPTKA